MTRIRAEKDVPEPTAPVDHGLLFSGAMVRALLGDIKTETRRLARPRWRAADRLWVRENWRADIAYNGLKPRELSPQAAVWFEADGGLIGNGVPGRVRSSMFMPRWASRLTLFVEEVRSERLQAITRSSAMAEGLTWASPTYGVPGIASTWHGDPRMAYAALWDSLNKPGSRWADNPLVWVTRFSVMKMNIDSWQ